MTDDVTPKVELPELPELPAMVDTYETGHYPNGYTANQMRAYATQAVLAERYIIDMLVAVGHVSAAKVDEARKLAAAIRKG